MPWLDAKVLEKARKRQLDNEMWAAGQAGPEGFTPPSQGFSRPAPAPAEPDPYRRALAARQVEVPQAAAEAHYGPSQPSYTTPDPLGMELGGFRRPNLGTVARETGSAIGRLPGALFTLSGGPIAMSSPLEGRTEGFSRPLAILAEEATRPINYLGLPVRGASFAPRAGAALRAATDVAASAIGRGAGEAAYGAAEGAPEGVRTGAALAAGLLGGAAGGLGAARTPQALRGAGRYAEDVGRALNQPQPLRAGEATMNAGINPRKPKPAPEGFKAQRDAVWERITPDIKAGIGHPEETIPSVDDIVSGRTRPHAFYRAMSDEELKAARGAGRFKDLLGGDLYITADPDRLAGGSFGARGGGNIVEFDPAIPVRRGSARYAKLDEVVADEIPWERVRRVYSWDEARKDHVLRYEARAAAPPESTTLGASIPGGQQFSRRLTGKPKPPTPREVEALAARYAKEGDTPENRAASMEALSRLMDDMMGEDAARLEIGQRRADADFMASMGERPAPVPAPELPANVSSFDPNYRPGRVTSNIAPDLGETPGPPTRTPDGGIGFDEPTPIRPPANTEARAAQMARAREQFAAGKPEPAVRRADPLSEAKHDLADAQDELLFMQQIAKDFRDPAISPNQFADKHGEAWTPKAIAESRREASDYVKEQIQRIQELEAKPMSPQGETLAGGIFPGAPQAARALREAGRQFKQQSVGDMVADILNLPRSLMASLDLSATLRQGGMLAAGRPRQFQAAARAQVQALVSNDAAKAVDDAIRSHPQFDLAQRAKLYLAPLDDPGAVSIAARERELTEQAAGKFGKGSFAPYESSLKARTEQAANIKQQALKMTDREEQFMSRLAGGLPGVKETQRAYVTMLNKLRADTFYSIVNKWDPEDMTDERLARLGSYINASTGRGDLPKMLKDYAPFMNAVFFSPRFLLSRFQTNAALFGALKAGDTKVAGEIARDLGMFYGTGVALLGLASLAGAKVETDSLSSDFGKIKVGDTRYDIWGGNQQIAVMVSRLIQGKRKTTTTGEIVPMGRSDALLGFMENKLSPVAGTVVDLSGKGQRPRKVEGPSDVVKLIAGLLAPITAADIAQGIAEEGPAGAAKQIPAAVGVGVTTFGNDPKSRASTALYDLENDVWQYNAKGMGLDRYKTRAEFVEAAVPAFRMKVLEDPEWVAEYGSLPPDKLDEALDRAARAQIARLPFVKDADKMHVEAEVQWAQRHLDDGLAEAALKSRALSQTQYLEAKKRAAKPSTVPGGVRR